jgi:hypothetical protein
MISGNRGQVLIVFVAALLGLLGIAALGIDMGYLYSVRHELQRSTDAGALAGASALFGGDWEDPAIRTVADARARDYASRDMVVSSTLNPTAELRVSFPSRDWVRVDATRTVNLFFASIFLGPTWNVTAFSVAEASIVDRNVQGLKPWGIPYPWQDLDKDGIWDPGEPVHTGCDKRYPPEEQFCNRTPVILKIGTPQNSPKNPTGTPSTQQEPGHFFALDYDASGAAGYRDGIISGSNYPVSITDAVPLETGDMVGPTIQGVKELIQADANSEWPAGSEHPHSSEYSSEGGSDAWMSSPRIVRIPIYNPSEGPLAGGKSEMVVAGFAGFWIEGIGPQGTVYGRFAEGVRVVGMGGPSTGPVTGPVLRNLRLVQ